MKRLGILLLFLLFFSCSMYWDDVVLPFIPENEMEIDVWIFENIEPRREEIQNWATPETTFNRGYGDCEDLCLLFMYFCYIYLDKKYTMYSMTDPNTGKHHTCVPVNADYCFFENGKYSVFRAKYKYDDAMRLAYIW